ncbi:hypothetical protein LCGC14_0851890 [marine sediment metagenome]|uniref:Uncharacterized protein n=1 Tax=marine sediment metagenome TaxID=412755 RepID=A0A0F9PVA4_9ZZZZ
MAAADTAVILELSGQNPINFTCPDDLSISKGTLLFLSEDLTVRPSEETANQKYAGVAAADKAAGDLSTRIAVYVPNQSNVFDMKAAASAITAGVMVCLSGINLIRAAVDAEFEAGQVIGQAQETAAATDFIRVIS